MWEEVKKRLDELKVLDTGGLYNFEFPGVAMDQEIIAFEEKLGIELPAQLKSFYLQMGNGGPAPEAGLYPIGQVENLRADRKWLGCEHYDDLELDFEQSVCGLLTIMGAGYAHANGIVTNGDEKGKIIAFSSSGGWIFVQSASLTDFYNQGLDEIFAMFNEMKTLIEAGEDTYPILLHFSNPRGTHPHNTLLRIASLIELPFQYDSETRPAISYIWYEKSADTGEEVLKIKAETESAFNEKIAEYRKSGRAKSLSKIVMPDRLT